MQRSAFSEARRLFRAPGRVNLIGEHTDYNGGFTMPAAIGFATQVSVTPRPGRRIVAHSEYAGEQIEIDLDTRPAPKGDWSDYIRAVALSLETAGYELHGANLFISSDIPIGAGLSSSAALEVAAGLALLGCSGIELEARELALLCQRAENEFVGVRCGIMDQLTSCMGRHGHALLLDCRSLEISYVRMPESIRMVACNSMVKHALASGEYNRRREECESARRKLSRVLPDVRELRDVTMAGLERHREELDAAEYRRCRHVISENGRTLQAAEALRKENAAECGALMHASHDSLRDDYEVSCRELDTLVELAMSQPGVYGSRMTGGGFGGCTISLVQETFVESFVKQISAAYAQRIGVECEIYVLDAADGAREIRE